MNIPVKIIKAFTTESHSGNPAGIIIDTLDLDTAQMQLIAKKVNVSECAFVTKINGIYHLRYFSPSKEMDFCGHATIAAFHALDITAPHSLLFETRLGLKRIEKNTDGIYWLHMGKLELSYSINDTISIAHLLNIAPEDIHMTQVYSVGVPKLLIKVSNLHTLFKIEPKFQEISHYCQTMGIRGFYPFTSETLSRDSTFHARQFNPLAGINEDPITGMAGAALGAWYGKNCIIEQGHCMDAFGRMFVEIDESIRVGGHTVIFKDIFIKI